ncbi:hypothetical protein H5P28_10140 [Ruficoccus amylovorans]|uniref:Uncharacterized protein n=1 Tax=Ruficoccus amylovorans TaxID=1804625 RepID=A0A842HF00_9BACT|nr:hypothetical protein [Ruficoccus amylovorans]MBC2594618.1 hypothetical protein [Ruficoccus amylovorans]
MANSQGGRQALHALHVDGSVSATSREEMDRQKSWNQRIYLMMGISTYQ